VSFWMFGVVLIRAEIPETEITKSDIESIYWNADALHALKTTASTLNVPVANNWGDFMKDVTVSGKTGWGLVTPGLEANYINTWGLNPNIRTAVEDTTRILMLSADTSSFKAQRVQLNNNQGYLNTVIIVVKSNGGQNARMIVAYINMESKCNIKQQHQLPYVPNLCRCLRFAFLICECRTYLPDNCCAHRERCCRGLDLNEMLVVVNKLNSEQYHFAMKEKFL